MSSLDETFTVHLDSRTLPGAPTLSYLVGDLGAGRPLVLLHGLSAHSASWAPVIDHLAPDWRGYALDFRGHGRSARTPADYRLAGYVSDTTRLLDAIGEPAIVVGHSLGAIVAAALAQDGHPMVAAVFLEDPPLYLLEPTVFEASSFARTFRVLGEVIAQLQTDGAPVETYRDLLAASPHPGGGRLSDRLHDDALWARASALAQTDPAAIAAVVNGETFAGFDPDRSLRRPALVVSADPAYDPGFRPADHHRLHQSSPTARVVQITGAAHNIRGERIARRRYLDLLSSFLREQAAPVTNPRPR